MISYIKSYTPNFNHALIRIFLVKGNTLVIKLLRPIGNVPDSMKSQEATDEQIKHLLDGMPDGFGINNELGLIHYPTKILTSHNTTFDKMVKIAEMNFILDEANLGKHAASDKTSWAFTYNPHLGLSFMNRTAHRLEYRTPLETLIMLESIRPIATVSQRYKTDKLEDCLFILNVDAGVGYHHNLKDVKEVTEFKTEISDFMPSIQVEENKTMIKVGETKQVRVNVLVNGVLDPNANCTLYLNEVSGYLPKKRVEIVNGKGSFDVIPMGLKIGDKVNINIGWKNWPNEINYEAVVY